MASKHVQSGRNILEDIENKKRKSPPVLYKKGKDDNNVRIEGTQKEIEQLTYQTLGTTDPVCGDALLNQIVRAHPDLNTNNIADKVLEIAPLLQAIAPRDELEGMLGAQMVVTHHLVMEMAKRASDKDQIPEGVNNNINRVTKLSRTFIAQIEALDKHRGKGQQKITVEHVHVNQGGQAIIGSVERGEGGDKK